MNDATPFVASAALTVSELRAEMQLTLAEMGERCGISKSQMHEVERTSRASLTVALAIEKLSDGRIDAAALSDDVRKARHGMDTTPAASAASPDKACANIGTGAAA